MSVLIIDRLEVGPERVEAVVHTSDPALTRTSAVSGIAEKALELLPGLARHTCENGSAHGMVAELADTEIPHLFEHIVVECMALAGSPRTLRAETSWDFARDGQHVYRVRFAYDNDLVALAAMRGALGIVDWLAGVSADKPDIAGIVEALCAARVSPAMRA